MCGAPFEKLSRWAFAIRRSNGQSISEGQPPVREFTKCLDDLREWVDTQPAIANSSELEKKLLMLMKYVCSEDTCINEYYLTMEQYLLICLVLEGDDWLAHTHKEDPSVGAPFKYSNGGYHKQKKLTLQNIAHLTSALPTFSTTDCIISL